MILAWPFVLAPLARRSRRAEWIIAAILSALLFGNYLAYLAQSRSFGALNWTQMLPLQLCDWALLVVVVASWTHRQRWFEVAYFWGLGGTLQALLTPNLAFGFPDFRFISFFLAHGVIVIGVVLLILVHRLRPTARSIARVFAWTELYFVIAFATDWFTGVNYGFLLHKPEAKTLLNFLSDDRILYLVQMHLLAFGFFAALYLPFFLYDLARPQPRAEVHV